MRTNLVRFISAFVLVSLVVACGGGGGGGSGGNGGGGSGIDQGVANASDAVLASASAPDASLQNFLSEVKRVYDSEADFSVASDKITTSYLNSIQNSGDLQTLYDAMQKTGSVFATQPGIAGTVQTLAGVDCPIQEGGTVIYFINGIWNTPWDAIHSRQALVDGIHSHDATFPESDIRLFYNKTGTEGKTLQTFCDASVVSGVWQTELFGIAAAWRAMRERTCGAIGGLFDLSEAFGQWLSFDPGSSANDVIKFRGLIQQDILSGKGVVIVAHSQGNFFAQRAIDGLPSDSFGDLRKSVALVALASPANYPNWLKYEFVDHLTLNGDFIGGIPGSLNPNGENELTRSGVADQFSIHEFLPSYIGQDESREKILDMIDTARVSFIFNPNPRASAGQGFFQVTATWNTPGDIDLHVFEPTGSHVYYSNKQGSVGELDRDDIPGTGPENYYVCLKASMVPGNYDVYVNNYAGTAGTTVTVNIRAGTQVRSYQKIVGSPNGSSTPAVFVGTVTYDSSGTFTFSAGGGFGEINPGVVPR